jgi:hypothetical protein
MRIIIRKAYALILSLTLCSILYSMETQETTYAHMKLRKMACAFIISRAIHTAAEIKVADHLVNGPAPIKTLAEKTNTDEDSLHHLLQLLTAHNIFAEDISGNFSLTPMSEHLVSTKSCSLWPSIIELGDTDRWTILAKLNHSLEKNNPTYDTIFKKNFSDYLSNYICFDTSSDESMQDDAEDNDTLIAKSYNFSNYPLLMNIAQRKGKLLAKILLLNKHIRGVLLGSPAIEKSATAYLKSLGLSERTSFMQSAFFKIVPCCADLYILKKVLRHWDDELSIIILHNCHEAMKDNSRLLIIEQIIPENTGLLLMDMGLDKSFPGLPTKKERTKTEWLALLDKTNLTCITIHSTPTTLSIIEAEKKLDPSK